jgi:MFS family permease
VTAALLAFNRRTFLSLRRYRNFRLFFGGQAVSLVGTWMQRLAQAWLIHELTRSPVALGLLVFAQFLPFTIFGLWAGVIVDRLDPRRTVIGTQAAQMVLSSVLAAITLAGVVQAWHVYALAFLLGTVQVLDAPSRQALTYRMVGPRELPNAVALNSSLFNGSRIFGPAVAGVLIAATGVGVCFAINAASFVAVLIGLLLMRPDEFHPVEVRERPTILRGTREGLAYVWRARDTLLVLTVVTIVSTFCFNFPVLLPVLATGPLHGSSALFGSLMAVFGAGALLGAITAASIGRASMRLFLAGNAAFCALQIVLALQHSAAGAALILFAVGASFTLWTSSSNATLQLAAPDHLRGRVVGLFYYAFNGFGAFGGLAVGWLASAGGIGIAFALPAAVGIVATAGAWLARNRPLEHASETHELRRAA